MELSIHSQSTHVYTGGKALNSNLPAAVLIHGAQQDHSCWNHQADWFVQNGFTVLAPDLPGHGRSDGGPLGSIEEMADWIVTLLDAAGIQGAVMVGHSMGSLIAIEAALRYPERVSRLVLIGSSMPMPVSPVLLEAARHDEAKAAAIVNTFSFATQTQAGDEHLSKMREMNLQIMERQQPGVFGCDLNACNAYARPITDLSAIDKPTLVLVGEQDRMTPAKASRAIAATIPGSTLVVLKDAGHALMAEQPDALIDHLGGFLS